MIGKPLTIVISHCSDALRQRGEALGDGLTKQVGGFVG